MNKKFQTAKLMVSDRYLASLWNYKKYSKKSDIKFIDGIYTTYIIRSICAFKAKENNPILRELALKTENEIVSLLDQRKASINDNIEALNDLSSINIIVSDDTKDKKFLLALPNSESHILKNPAIKLLSLFECSSRLTVKLYELKKMGVFGEKSFIQNRFKNLKPLRVLMNDISNLAKKFHLIRKENRKIFESEGLKTKGRQVTP